MQFLTEQARLASRRQEERAELVHDVMPIVNDAFRIATEQLEEVQDYVDLSDLLRLLKRLLRNARNIDTMLDQLESLMDLAQTVGPLTDSAFEKATDLLQAAEQKGYFAFAKDGARVVDNVVGEMALAQPVDSFAAVAAAPDARPGCPPRSGAQHAHAWRRRRGKWRDGSRQGHPRTHSRPSGGDAYGERG